MAIEITVNAILDNGETIATQPETLPTREAAQYFCTARYFLYGAGENAIFRDQAARENFAVLQANYQNYLRIKRGLEPLP